MEVPLKTKNIHLVVVRFEFCAVTLHFAFYNGQPQGIAPTVPFVGCREEQFFILNSSFLTLPFWLFPIGFLLFCILRSPFCASLNASSSSLQGLLGLLSALEIYSLMSPIKTPLSQEYIHFEH